MRVIVTRKLYGIRGKTGISGAIHKQYQIQVKAVIAFELILESMAIELLGGCYGSDRDKT